MGAANDINRAVTVAALLQRRILARDGDVDALRRSREAILVPLRAAIRAVCAAAPRNLAEPIFEIPGFVFPGSGADKLPKYEEGVVPCVSTRYTLDQGGRRPRGQVRASTSSGAVSSLGNLGVAPILIAVAAIAAVGASALLAHEVRKALEDPTAVANAEVARQQADVAADILDDLHTGKITEEEAEKRLTLLDKGFEPSEGGEFPWAAAAGITLAIVGAAVAGPPLYRRYVSGTAASRSAA